MVQAKLRAVSFKDSLRKTVIMLAGEGVNVQFRGFQPRVEVRGGKVIRMVLPEVGDEPSEILVQAMHGFLDHELGHMLVTPFTRAVNFANGNRHVGVLANIVEDIRLEKLVPRQLPGMKHNLERMYQFFIPQMIAPSCAEAVATGNPSRQFFGVMVPAMRGLAGQKDFQKFMDDMGYWQYFAPLLKRMPKLSRRLRDMETFADVEGIVTDILAELEQMMPKEDIESAQQAPTDMDEDDEDQDSSAQQSPQPGEPSDEDGDDGDQDGDSQPGDEAGEEGDDGQPGDEDGDAGSGADGEPGDDGDDGEPGDKDDKGTGHGKGDGYDDGEGDEDDDECSGDGDEDGDHRGGTGDSKDDGSSKSGDDGKNNVSITDALKQLEPTQRRAMFLYKRHKLSVSEIANQTQSTEEQVKDLLVAARRRLKEIMIGG